MFNYPIYNFIKIFNNVRILKSNYLITHHNQVILTVLVISHLVLVDRAIKFDDKPGTRIIKIYNIFTNYMLATKFYTIKLTLF